MKTASLYILIISLLFNSVGLAADYCPSDMNKIFKNDKKLVRLTDDVVEDLVEAYIKNKEIEKGDADVLLSHLVSVSKDYHKIEEMKDIATAVKEKVSRVNKEKFDVPANLESNLQKLEASLDFPDKKILDEFILELRKEMKNVIEDDETLKIPRLDGLDVSKFKKLIKLPITRLTNFKANMLEFAKTKSVFFLPLVVFPLMAKLNPDIDMSKMIVGGGFISGAILTIETYIDKFMAIMKKIVSPKGEGIATGAVSNVPELLSAVTFAATLKAIIPGINGSADGLMDVGLTPIGSNWANIAIWGLAAILALGYKKVGKAAISPFKKNGAFDVSSLKAVMKKFGKKELLESWQKVNDHGVLRPLKDATLFFGLAQLFQTWVTSSFNANDSALASFGPLAGWLTASLGFSMKYMRDIVNEGTEKNLGTLAAAKIKKLDGVKEFDELEEYDRSLINSIIEISNDLHSKIKVVEDEIKYADGSDIDLKEFRKTKLKKLKNRLKVLSIEVNDNDKLRNNLLTIISKNDELNQLLTISKLDKTSYKYMQVKDQRAMWLELGKIIGITSIAGLGLNYGLDQIVNSGMGASKGSLSFYFMSVFSSLPEGLITYKFFKLHRNDSATENIAVSNSINLMLAKLAMIIGAMKL